MIGRWLMIGCWAAVPTLAARAEPPLVPRSLPALSATALELGSFDVRAFDPLGMSRSSAPSAAAPNTQAKAAAAMPAPQDLHVAADTGFFSDGWSRDGFNSRR